MLSDCFVIVIDIDINVNCWVLPKKFEKQNRFYFIFSF